MFSKKEAGLNGHPTNRPVHSLNTCLGIDGKTMINSASEKLAISACTTRAVCGKFNTGKKVDAIIEVIGARMRFFTEIHVHLEWIQ